MSSISKDRREASYLMIKCDQVIGDIYKLKYAGIYFYGVDACIFYQLNKKNADIYNFLSFFVKTT